MLELGVLIWAFGVALGAPATVVTFDNGEFNAPLFTPRWNGSWQQPSMAQEVAQSVARALHHNPRVFAYMPPGRVAARPGGLVEVASVAPGCTTPGSAPTDPSDPCWCGPASNCWGALAANYHPATSTSLFGSVATLRQALAGQGPRIEIHFTDLFEEDPASADDPSNSDRCVTEAGVRRALQGVMGVSDSESLDHLAVGLLRVDIDPPPPGPSWGNTYGLDQVEDSPCWSGHKTGPWQHRRGSWSMTVGVLVVGVDTAPHHTMVTGLIDALQTQLDTEHTALGLVRVREPAAEVALSAVLSPRDVLPWVVPAADAGRGGLPCTEVEGAATFTSEGHPVAVERVVGRCDGYTEVYFARRRMRSTFLAQAGLDPTRHVLQLTGSVRLLGDGRAFAEALDALAPLNDSDRPLPLWSALPDALGVTGPAAAVFTPWEQRVEVGSLRVTGLDTRPWFLVVMGSVALAIAVGATIATILRQLHATRAMRLHWDRSVGPGADPLRVRPLAMVIASAQEEVDRQWAVRGTIGSLSGMVTGLLSMWMLMQLYRIVVG